MLRFLVWRTLGALAAITGLELIAWLLGGGLGRVLRGNVRGEAPVLGAHISLTALAARAHAMLALAPPGVIAGARSLLAVLLALAVGVVVARSCARRRRRYVRLRIDVYRADSASAEAVVRMFAALHRRAARPWSRRLLLGQPSLALEVHHCRADGRSNTWLAVCVPCGLERAVETALQGAYPNCRARSPAAPLGVPPALVRLKKRSSFIRRVKVLDRFEHEREPPMNRLLSAMASCEEPAFVQLSMTPAPALLEAFAARLYRHHEARLSRRRGERVVVRERSMLDDVELRSGLELQHSPLFFADLRVIAATRSACERIAAELRVESAENRLIERGAAVRHGILGLDTRRVQRGEGNPLPDLRTGLFAPGELAAMWHLPSTDFLAVPFARASVPLAPAAPAIWRPRDAPGTLRDANGGVSIHPELRRQNTAVPGTVEQGKSSYLVATVAEDLLRERCAVIVLDPKGDAAEAAVGLVPEDRTCTLLDFARPTCGFNPLAVDAPADVIADYVVAALKNLFTDADIRASSDRYLRNAIIAVLAHDRASTLWDAARLLSVGEEGYSYRSRVSAELRTLPEFKEISGFFAAELSAQLADARAPTTAKLDAPVNKLARLLNSPSIKRVLLNESLRVDFDEVIAGEEVLVVKGALGAMGAGNTSVLMQLLVGMLDAALARQQDLVPEAQRVAVALKIDEAPIVLNRGFAETMALKRSAGLETVACWQTDAQWVDRDVREQLDALFAHRVYFATASTRDARASAQLTMAEFSDTVRPGVERLSSLGHPDVRLHLPKHHAIVSWSTREGRQPPFMASTIPLHVDKERVLLHAAAQHRRGGRHLADLRQPHWDRPSAVRAEDSEPARADAPPGAVREPPPMASLPELAAASYRELVDLDRAQSVSRKRARLPHSALEPDRLDLEILALIAAMRHVLSSQIHRRFNPRRAHSTTQRRLKRLADAGLVERFQFHRADGGGAPMCYLITASGLRALGGATDRDGADPRHASASASDLAGEARLRRARRDIHVAGWVLALTSSAAAARGVLRGCEEAVMQPPRPAGGERSRALGPRDLQLPGGRTPHDFLRTDAAGGRSEVERFETLRPDVIIEVPGGPPGDDVIVEFDDRAAGAAAIAKLERYDHFLAGWSLHTRRYGRRAEALPLVVFVCSDRARARAWARAADPVLGACRAYAGEYPFDWEYPGRERVLFAAERDAHEGLLSAYGVPRLPPAARVAAAHGDPRAGEARLEPRAILDGRR